MNRPTLPHLPHLQSPPVSDTPLRHPLRSVAPRCARARSPWALAAALAVLAGCSTTPAPNAQVEAVRSSLRLAQSDPQTQGLAGGELRLANEALAAADAAVAQSDDASSVDHLAYVAQQRVTLLREAGSRRAAEAAVARANSERDQMRLAARTQEVAVAQNNAAASQLDAMVSQRRAESAQRDAQTSQREAQASQRDAQLSQRDTATAQRDTLAAQRETEQAQQQAGEAERRAAALKQQLSELNARQTDRGMVVTIGDVLFDTDQAQVKSGGLRSMDKLVAFLQAHPQRRAMIEGFTDSVGDDEYNLALSSRRADAVRLALVGLGVNAERLSTMGYGEAFPVAGNSSSGGRQLNRRVEIVLSDDGGVVAPR